MPDIKGFLKDIIQKPPVLFPLVALAHVVWLLRVIWDLANFPLSRVEWINTVWMLAYTTCWLGSSSLRRWGGIGYILLTIVNIVLSYSLQTMSERTMWVSSIFPFDIVFSFFILVYYKRFR